MHVCCRPLRSRTLQPTGSRLCGLAVVETDGMAVAASLDITWPVIPRIETLKKSANPEDVGVSRAEICC